MGEIDVIHLKGEMNMKNTTLPLNIVNKRMEAHNQHNIESFLNTYSEDIQIYDYPDIPIGNKGKAHIEGIFKPLFEEKAVHTDIHHQIVNGNHVVNHETVIRNGIKSVYVSIYEIDNGLIKSVRFIKS